VTPGFRAAAAITVPGLVLLVNDGPDRDAAGLFSTDPDPAAPVLWSRQVLTSGRLRAVLLHAAGANSGTGPAGFQATHAAVEAVGRALDVGAAEVAECAAGPAGTVPPPATVAAGIAEAAAALPGAGRAPEGPAHHDPAGWSLAAVTAGATGGIRLLVLTTDARAGAAVLRDALAAALPGFGDGSANDTALLLASGASGVPAGAAELAEAVRRVVGETENVMSGSGVERKGAERA
jgi:glutamate N-acetyltransferase / amino-acid N-acetyltransferase